MRHNRLFIFTSILIASLTGLLALLIHWGNQAVELREALFVDRTKVVINQLITEMEDSYYCFDLRSEVALPKLDSFYLDHIPGLNLSKGEHLELKYQQASGEEKSFEQLPLMGPAHVQILLRFEFDNIPKLREDSSLSNFEKFVKDSYDQYIVDKNGIRLIDTTQFDSLLTLEVRKIYPQAILHYQLSITNDNEVIYQMDQSRTGAVLNPDITARIYEEDPIIPELTLNLEVLNKKDIFNGQSWNIYASAAILALISALLIFYLVRLQLQQKKLLKIQKDFVHGMTHEFNTPIANMKLLAKSLLKHPDDKVTRAGEILEEEGNKLQNGINLVLTTALIEKDELMLQKDLCELRKLIEKVAERNEGFLSNHGIKLNVQIREDVLQLEGDAYHLENVFQNMINNVVRHSDANSLNIEAERKNGHIIVRFSDNGKGISLADRDQIFEKFERRNEYSKNGYGLGLYYSRMILNLHGGHIKVDDQSSIGASFYIQLPA